MMSEPQEQQISETPENNRRPSKRRFFRLPDGEKVPLSDFRTSNSLEKDTLVYYLGEEKTIVPGTGKKVDKVEWITEYEPKWPLRDRPLEPSSDSPICKQCKLFELGCRSPFMNYEGADKPLVTIVFDGVNRHEDIEGRLGGGGSTERLSRIIAEASEETGVELKDIRWVPLTRCCANWSKKQIDLKSRGNWCRYHLVDDLMRHTPNVIIPVGTKALGALSHKSNAQEWSGRTLTYRGWPDDWLMTERYALPRVLWQPKVKKGEKPVHKDPDITGHPVFGPIPDWSIPMAPIQAPRLIDAAQSDLVYNDWKDSIIRALKLAKSGTPALNYIRPWYRFTEDVAEITDTLNELIANPGIRLCYDTETTGIRPWAADAAIVSMMFRWDDPKTGEPRSIGFPWDFGPTPEHPEWEESRIRPHIPKLKKLVWSVLINSSLVGHNLTFDMLYTFAVFWRNKLSDWSDSEFNKRRDSWLVALADACEYDTWHMAFAWQQKKGSLGLDAIAYDWVPDLAGYEEDMTLLINLHYEAMHPGAGKGGHYLNCPRDKWDSHLTSYVMGDVEVCYQAQDKIQLKLEKSNVYKFPLASVRKRGNFRLFTPQNRDWVYHNVMSPASRVLMKMMARGLYVDIPTLTKMEGVMPKKIKELRESLKTVDPRIEAWCAEQRATKKAENDGKEWELDLENKDQLKSLLFRCLNLPVLRFTKGGRKLLGDDVQKAVANMRRAVSQAMPEITDPKKLEQEVQKQLQEVAAVDKFTLNKICAEFKYLKPLQDYRRAFKLYSTYVRPLRNSFSAGLDKKQRTADGHLCFDNCLHAQFMLTGTASGRLASRSPNLQQLPRDGEVKSMFTSRFGKRGCMYQADLSQIELRLLAAACGDEQMVKAYFDNVDLHSLTTSHIFNVPYENFSKEYMKSLQEKGKDKEAKALDEKRSIGKTVNFLTGYGGGAFGLQNVLAMKDIGKTIEECQEIIDKFFDAYPALREMLGQYKRFILDSNVAVSIFGRVRVFEEVLGNDEEAKAKALRAGCNHLIQSTASDMMLTALFVIENLMRDADLESILVSTVHDSLYIDAVREELPKIHEIVMLVLNDFPGVFKAVFGDDYDTSWMLVPFAGDADVGTNMLSMKKIGKGQVDWDELLSDKV